MIFGARDQSTGNEVLALAKLSNASVTLTRPANTTPAYDALDAISDSTGNLLKLTPDIWPEAGQSGYIVKAVLRTNVSTWTAPVRVHLYNSAVSSTVADKAAWPMLWANQANRVGAILFSGWQTGGTGSDMATSMIVGNILPINAAAAEKTLWARFVIEAAATPASGQLFYLEITVEPR